MEKKKNNLWLRVCFFSFLLVVTILSFLRIPYFGVFIDSIVLDFLFGSGKLIVYIISLFICLSSFAKNTKVFKFATKRKTWIAYCVVLNIYLMIISLIYWYGTFENYIDPQACFSAYFGEDWNSVANSEYVWTTSTVQLLHPGIIWFIILLAIHFKPIIFVYIGLILLVAYALIYLFYRAGMPAVVSFVNSLKKIKTYFSKQSSTTESQERPNVQQTKKNATGEILKNISRTEMIPFSLNNEFNHKYQNFRIEDYDDVEENNAILNDEYAKNVINNIGEVFEKSEINCIFLEYQIGPSSLKILFSFPDEKQAKLITSENIHKKLVEVLQTKSFTFFVKDDRLIIDLPLIERNKISFKKTMEKFNKQKKDDVFSGLIGVDGNYEPIELDFNESPLTLVHGDFHSGKQNLLMQLVLSLLIRYSPNEFMIAVIDNQNSSLTELDRVRNMVDNIANSIETGIEMMEKIIFEMKYRVKLLNDFKVNTINELNENKNQMVPSLLIIINDINDFVNYDSQYVTRFLKLISKYAHKLNVYCIITTSSVTEAIASPENKKLYKNVISLQTRTSEESELIINKSILHKLFGEGDFYYIKNIEDPKIQRGQATFINNDLINQIIRKVNNY